MNKNLNAWLCKHFDRETDKTNECGDVIGKNPRKGYVTLWDIIKIGILNPLIVVTIIATISFIVIEVLGLFAMLLTGHENDKTIDWYLSTIYGVEALIAIGLIILIGYALRWIVSYKVAICPLVNPKEELKKEEEKMFDDIINH